MYNSNAYKFAQAIYPDEWDAIHKMRRSEIFEGWYDEVYSPYHQGDRGQNHFTFVLKYKGECIGTTRLDLFDDVTAAVRLVAISKDYQQKGHGRYLMQRFEEFARSMGISRLLVNAKPTATGFYERLGFFRYEWEEPGGPRTGVATICTRMVKQI